LCLPLLLFPCTIKSRSSLLAPAHPGGPGKKAVKRMWWWRWLRRGTKLLVSGYNLVVTAGTGIRPFPRDGSVWQRDTAPYHITSYEGVSNGNINHATAHLTALYPRQPGWAGTRRNIYSLTSCLCAGYFTTSLTNFLHLLRFIASCVFVRSNNLLLQCHYKLSLAFVLVLHLPLRKIPAFFHPVILILS